MSDSPVVIMSSEFCSPELAVEYGRIPPSFLPLGNLRLFHHQVKSLEGNFAPIFITLPEGFCPAHADILQLDLLGVEIIWIKQGVSLGTAVLEVAVGFLERYERLAILHGDSLFEGLDLNVVNGVAVTDDYDRSYEWADVDTSSNQISILSKSEIDDSSRDVLSGFFMIGDLFSFVQSLRLSDNSFVDALAFYGGLVPLERVRVKKSYDFGHFFTFYKSKRDFLSSRSFNSLSVTGRTVRKAGSHKEKIRAEALWYKKLPPRMLLHTPAFLGGELDGLDVYYEVEYLNLPTLSDLFVYGNQSLSFWSRVFGLVDEMIEALHVNTSKEAAEIRFYEQMYYNKTVSRFSEFCAQSNFETAEGLRFHGEPLPPVQQIIDDCYDRIVRLAGGPFSHIHGDLCFSNMLFDYRSDIIKVIDPRGLSSVGELSNYGDPLYDIAKLHHSIFGLYDHIIAGRFRLVSVDSRDYGIQVYLDHPSVVAQEAFYSSALSRYHPFNEVIKARVVLLFISMLPLHSDSPLRQRAFLANAFRLYREL